MMNYYRELTLLPDAEVPLSFLWTKIFTQIHLALAEQKEKEGTSLYGLSFPEYGEDRLGSKLRIFAETGEQLDKLPLDRYLRRYGDYMHLTHTRPVPPRRIKGYAAYSRYQPDGNKAAKARRFARRHGVSYTEAFRTMKRRKETYDYPYIQIQSLSNGHSYTLLIRKEEKQGPQDGTFSTYGLSRTAVVPEF